MTRSWHRHLAGLVFATYGTLLVGMAIVEGNGGMFYVASVVLTGLLFLSLIFGVELDEIQVNSEGLKILFADTEGENGQTDMTRRE